MRLHVLTGGAVCEEPLLQSYRAYEGIKLLVACSDTFSCRRREDFKRVRAQIEGTKRQPVE